MKNPKTTIISDEQIRHQGKTQGVVVTRVQTVQIEFDGEPPITQKVQFWHDLATGKLHHMS